MLPLRAEKVKNKSLNFNLGNDFEKFMIEFLKKKRFN
jgi:hypothetical protein